MVNSYWSCVVIACSYHSADSDTDRSSVCSKVELHIRKLQYSKKLREECAFSKLLLNSSNLNKGNYHNRDGVWMSDLN